MATKKRLDMQTARLALMTSFLFAVKVKLHLHFDLDFFSLILMMRL